ncbi:LysR family transcriptional regulator [Hyphomicrobium sp.]|uniref:LysR family transcriptional regulator n=1 Tax=Hyphomicrobium sp. TaxID=82 RepID=UPI0025B7D925|nr:LysR family transcriptional regulator [Hyphomicrobium sp.]MCC7253656.1 LysR family transcriptional regulator [Hyphomicrobium sp.]
MHAMNSDRFDLNLLVVFDAVARTGSVTAAAARLSVSQPAVSHALNRLRDLLGDPLFVRNRNALVPTPRAQAMIEPVRSIVEAARDVVQRGAFDPGTSERVFRVGGSDYTMTVVVPALARLLRARAASSTLDLVPIGPQTLASLESGELDCSLWGTTVPGAPYLSRALFREHFIGVIGSQHPLARKAKKGELTLDDYLAYPHAATQFRLSVPSPIDTALAKLGRSRTIGFTSPNFASNVAALRDTDMVMAVPSRLVSVLVDKKSLVSFELPFDIPNHPYSLIWHRRSDADPACRWLREMVVAAAQTPQSRTSAR